MSDPLFMVALGALFLVKGGAILRIRGRTRQKQGGNNHQNKALQFQSPGSPGKP
jgi:hypothetical protein